MTKFDLNFKIVTAITKAGRYPDSPEGTLYGSIEIPVGVVAYLNFPRERDLLVDEAGRPFGFWHDYRKTVAFPPRGLFLLTDPKGNDVWVKIEETHPLIKMLRAGVPTDKKGLQDWSEEAVTSSLRAAVAQMTWKEANENPLAVRDRVEQIFMSVDGALIGAGFRPDGIKLAIQSIDLPETLKSSMSGKEAAAGVAEKDSEESAGRVLRMVARASGKTVKELEDDLNTHPEKRGKSAADGGYKEAFAYAEDQTKRDRAGDGLEDIRVGSVDGTSLEPAIGAIAAMFGLGKRKGSRRSGNPSGQGNQGQQGVKDDDPRISRKGKRD